MEWVLAEQAGHAFGAADVPLYDTLGEEAIDFILQQCELNTVFTDVAGLRKLMAVKKEAKGAHLGGFKQVVQFEDLGEDGPALRKACADVGLTLHSFEEVAAAGRANPHKHSPPAPSDLGFICYTSGTTGMPKGAMILHRNMVAMACSAIKANLGVTQADIHLSYLPLAHIMERLLTSFLYMVGASIGFFQGDTLKLIDDLKALRPTIFPSVPRLWNRIYDRITAGVVEGGAVKSAVFHTAYAGKQYWLRTTGTTHHSVWDRIVFRTIAARVGLDRCRLMITGSAPIAPHVMEFLRVVFSTNVVEGYGQTECAAACTLTSVDDQKSMGNVGAPLTCCDVKLVSVPDMGYNVTDTVHGQELDGDKVVNPGIACIGRGEVCVRGFNVFPGYYKDAEKTAEALDSAGWLHTGDVGLWDSNGNLRIIDRKKNIFKLSQGEYVAAEKVETIVIKSALAGQAFVYGDSLHSMLVAIVTPKEDALKSWAKANVAGYTAESMSVKVLCEREDVKKTMLEGLRSMCKEARLQSFEIPKAIHIESGPWSPENLLTPSFKLKRAEAKKMYEKHIVRMYDELNDNVAGMRGLKQVRALAPFASPRPPSPPRPLSTSHRAKARGHHGPESVPKNACRDTPRAFTFANTPRLFEELTTMGA
jgi:long-chain acyl-CoA synthetase